MGASMHKGSERLLRRFPLIAIVGALLTLASLAPASASVCTLADHIRSANTSTAVGFCPAGTSHDIITIAQDITLTEALPVITSTITIEGGGHTISGADQFRIFDVAGGNLTIKNLTLTKGKAPDEEDGGALRLGNGSLVTVEHVSFSDNAAFQGGAIAASGVDARLSVQKSNFLRNSSADYAGAVFAEGGMIDVKTSSFQNNQAGYYGGAIAAHAGRMSISNSTFAGNSADGGGALEVFAAEVSLTHVTMMNNVGKHVHGDAIHRTAGVINLRNSIVGGAKGCTGRLTEARGNLSQDGSCALLERKIDPMLGELTGSPAWYPLLDGSPALDAGDPAFCLETDQIGTARPQGGGCDIGAIESLTGNPPPTPVPVICTLHDQIIAANTDRAYRDCPAGRGADTILMIRDYTDSQPLPTISSEITIHGNGHTISGGGQRRIFDVAGGALTLKNLTLSSSRAVSGSAVRLRDGARVAADGVTFTKGTAENGGAIAVLSADASATINNSRFLSNRSNEYGGAIYVLHGAVSVANSSFVNNRAGFFGGALHSEYGRFTVSNSTFNINQAVGGGALNVHSGQATLTHVTMLDNVATQTNGDAIANESGRILLRNSIIYSDGEAADCDGGMAQSRGNLSPDGSCAAPASADPRLDRRTGSPAYHPLLDGSPAVDAADPEFCPETDQRGTPRPQGGGCDVGAIESMTASPAVSSPAPPVCSLYDQIIAANTDRPSGLCPAGNGADTIFLSEDITLNSRLPAIASGLAIEGNGHTISGDGRFPIFTVRGTWLKINSLTLTEGSNPRGNGGAINMLDNASVVVNNSSFISNEALNGGAITMYGRDSRLVIFDSSFTGNRAAGLAGGIGGAIDMRSGELHITGSSFSGNHADSGGAINIGSGEKVSIANSSFSENSARIFGGALAAAFPQTTLTHVTMVNNEAKTGSGVWARSLDISNLRIRNSVIAGGDGLICSGPLTQNIGNLIEDGSCSPRLSGDPLLGEWTGSRGYHPLQAGSPAIDSADPRFCLKTDQLGTPRPQGGGCDIGAIEFPDGSPAQVESAASETDAACAVTTTHALNFRDGPQGARIGLIPGATTLAARARSADWFNVEYRGVWGWVSAVYVRARGVCG